MLALLQTVGRPVLTSGSAAVSTTVIVSGLAAASAPATESDCRVPDVLTGVVWLHAVQNSNTSTLPTIFHAVYHAVVSTFYYIPTTPQQRGLH